jgi:hypothetical protein
MTSQDAFAGELKALEEEFFVPAVRKSERCSVAA